MYEIKPFSKQHAIDLTVQPHQSFVLECVGDWYESAADGLAFSALYDGEPIALAGIMPFGVQRAGGWSILSCELKPHMLWLTRKVGLFLDMAQGSFGYRRVETTVMASFANGHRWAKLLGFEPEGRLRCYDRKGEDHIMYARIR